VRLRGQNGAETVSALSSSAFPSSTVICGEVSISHYEVEGVIGVDIGIGVGVEIPLVLPVPIPTPTPMIPSPKIELLVGR
jgi:hypothetical protein